MDRDQLRETLLRSIEGRRLLEHPFYRRWEAGTLDRSELATYAEQYRTIERALPGVLDTVVDDLPPGPARQFVAANLADELGRPVAHTELFESFADAVGARSEVPATPATADVVACQTAATRRSPRAALAALAAYELQSEAIAASKADGLRSHYGIDDRGTRFWDVHASMEASHAEWSIDALATLVASPEDLAEVADAADAAARAWWSFLDDREASAPAVTVG